MFRDAHIDNLSCTRSLALTDLTAVAGGLVRTLAIGAFWCQILALVGRAFPGRMLLRAESTMIPSVWALSLYMPVSLALLAHLHPSFSVIRPIGERMGTPYRTIGNRIVGNDWACKLNHK